MSSLLQKRIWLQQLNILFIFEGRKHQAGHGQNNWYADMQNMELCIIAKYFSFFFLFYPMDIAPIVLWLVVSRYEHKTDNTTQW